MIVADSDVLIEYLRGRDPHASRVEIELQTRSFGTTCVTAYELWSGARARRQEMAVEALLGAMTILPLDEEGARCAADAQRAATARGQKMAAADALIAGICLAHGATLRTNNRRHFEGIEGLRLSMGANTAGDRRR